MGYLVILFTIYRNDHREQDHAGEVPPRESLHHLPGHVQADRGETGGGQLRQGGDLCQCLHWAGVCCQDHTEGQDCSTGPSCYRRSNCTTCVKARITSSSWWS